MFKIKEVYNSKELSCNYSRIKRVLVKDTRAVARIPPLPLASSVNVFLTSLGHHYLTCEMEIYLISLW